MDSFDAESSYFRKSFVSSTLRRCSARQAAAVTGFTSQQLRQSLSNPVKLSSYMSCGCCVLVDISGFSKLSSIAFENGTAGLDQFRRLVTEVFNRLIAVIDDCGGDGEFVAVLRFFYFFREARGTNSGGQDPPPLFLPFSPQ